MNEIAFSIQEQYKKKFKECVTIDHQLQEKIDDIDQVFNTFIMMKRSRLVLINPR